VVTLEIDPRHAEAAQANFAHAGVADRIELRLGPALETLPKLAAEGYGPFDIVFIDADKPNNAEYLKWGVRLARPRTLIICDNIVRDGEVADPDNPDANVRGARAFIDLVARDPRLTGTVIQTVGSKGYDGFAIAVVLASQ
jgi:predicted O-methyltransferase YrrM